MLNGKAAEMMIRAAVGAMGIDADSLLLNIQQFQQWVQNAVQHHDKRLVALENQGVVNGEKLDRILELLEAETRESDIFGGEFKPGHITGSAETIAAVERLEKAGTVDNGNYPAPNAIAYSTDGE